jgi:hypothetical protein
MERESGKRQKGFIPPTDGILVTFVIRSQNLEDISQV